MRINFRTVLIVAVIAILSFLAQPSYAWHGHCGHGHFYSFGFGFYSAPPVYVSPAPVFVAPPPVVYYAPPVVAAAPVVVQQPAVIQPPPVSAPPAEAQPSDSPPSRSNFVETSRRYHRCGDNAGRLDWVEGLLDGRAVRIYYDDFGRVTKQKWVD